MWVFLGLPNQKRVRYFIRLLGALSICINLILCTGIWNLKICWLIMIKLSGLLTSVYLIPIGSKKDWRLPVGRLVTRRLKWLKGKISMKQSWWIFGVVELYFMQCCVVVCHLRTHKHQNSTKRFSQVNTKFQSI